MARPKKTSPKNRRKASSSRSKRTAVVWIAPDLERITKGERGRRGLADPTSGYYLRLADLALTGTSAPAAKSTQPTSLTPTEDELLFSRPLPLGHETETPLPAQGKRSKASSPKGLKSPPSLKQPRVEVPRRKPAEHPKLSLPRLHPPKPPKFDPPKPPKSPKKPKPPRHAG